MKAKKTNWFRKSTTYEMLKKKKNITDTNICNSTEKQKSWLYRSTEFNNKMMPRVGDTKQMHRYCIV